MGCQTQSDVVSLPNPPPDGSTVEEILTYLDTIRVIDPVPHAVVTLNGYTFRLDWPRIPMLPPTMWYITSTSPATARDTQIARPRLGWQWCWEYAIDTIKAEIERVLTAIPTPDPGPWPPPL